MYLVRAVEALELHVTAISEVDTRSGNKLVNEMRDQNLVSERVAGDACRVVDRGTEEVVSFMYRIACVDPDPDADRGRGIGEGGVDRQLNRLRASDGAARARNASIDPSPCVSTIVPPYAPVVSLITSLCRRMTSSHPWSPRRAVSTVESTMSVKTIVTVPSAARLLERSGRSRWIVFSSCSRLTGNVTPQTSSFDLGSDQCT